MLVIHSVCLIAPVLFLQMFISNCTQVCMLMAALATAAGQVDFIRQHDHQSLQGSSKACVTFLYDNLNQISTIAAFVETIQHVWNPSQETMLQPLSGLAGLHFKCNGPAPDRQVSCCASSVFKKARRCCLHFSTYCVVLSLDKTGKSVWVLLWSGWLHGKP